MVSYKVLWELLCAPAILYAWTVWVGFTTWTMHHVALHNFKQQLFLILHIFIICIIGTWRKLC